jgi:murein DD-endopeptidase MepM/ murein hydrolase activator NlpD
VIQAISATCLVLVLIWGEVALHEQAIPESVTCGTAAGGMNETARLSKFGRRVGEIVRKGVELGNDPAAVEERVDDHLRRLFGDVFWYALRGMWQAANGDEKIDPLILKLEEDAAKTAGEANDACTPCPPGADVPDMPGEQEPLGPPVDSISLASGRAPAAKGRATAVTAASRYWTGRNLEIAVAIAGAESRYDPSVRSPRNSDGSYDHGLWQINSVHRDLLGKGDWRDPAMNAWMAYQVFRQEGNSWTPWTTYNSGSYRRYLKGGASVVAAAQGNTPPPARTLPQAKGNPAPRALTPSDPQDDPGAGTPGVVCQAPSDGTHPETVGNGIVDTRVLWPTSSRQRGTYRGHSGVDFNGPGNRTGTPFRAAASGKVTHTGGGKGYGDAVFVMTDTGYLTIYGHSSRIDVRVGQHVDAGQQLGLIGYSGNVRPKGPGGAHLHFEARKIAGNLGSYAGTMDFLAGKWPNRNAGAVAASSRGARKVTDPTSHVTYSIPVPAGPRGVAINFALDQLGEPYSHRANHGPSSWDCSGLTGAAWQAAGVKMTWQTSAMRRELPVTSSPTPGDLIYSAQPDHVQMYLGRIGGQTLIVEASRPGTDVRIVRQWMHPDAILDPTRKGAQA